MLHLWNVIKISSTMNIQIYSNHEYSKYNYYRQVDKGCAIPHDCIITYMVSKYKNMHLLLNGIVFKDKNII